MKYIWLIFSCCILKITSFAQSPRFVITFPRDTVIIKNSEVEFEVQFENLTTKKMSLFYAKDFCEQPQDDSSSFSTGLTPESGTNTISIFCDRVPRTMRLINPGIRQIDRMFKRDERHKTNGQLFCRKQKFVLKPGSTIRHYKYTINCKDLPPGEYQFQLIYHYFRDAPIDDFCVKCYPKIGKNTNFYEGKIISEPLILIKR